MSTHHTFAEEPNVGTTYYGDSTNLKVISYYVTGWCRCEIAFRTGYRYPEKIGRHIWITVGDLMNNYRKKQ
jgi:hypothetical protein